MTEPTIHNAIGLAKHIQGMCADREDHALIQSRVIELVAMLHRLARRSETMPELLAALKPLFELCDFFQLSRAGTRGAETESFCEGRRASGRDFRALLQRVQFELKAREQAIAKAASLFGARVFERCPEWEIETNTDLAEARDVLTNKLMEVGLLPKEPR